MQICKQATCVINYYRDHIADCTISSLVKRVLFSCLKFREVASQIIEVALHFENSSLTIPFAFELINHTLINSSPPVSIAKIASARYAPEAHFRRAFVAGPPGNSASLCHCLVLVRTPVGPLNPLKDLTRARFVPF